MLLEVSIMIIFWETILRKEDKGGFWGVSKVLVLDQKKFIELYVYDMCISM